MYGLSQIIISADANTNEHPFLQEKIISCYRLMQRLVLNDSRRKQPKVIPQLRVTIRARMRSSCDSSSSSSSSSSPTYKRRKLNNYLWVGDDKGGSE